MSEIRGASRGYVLGPTEGEHLIRNAGSLFIKVDPEPRLEQHGPGNAAVAHPHWHKIHQHHEADEILFVLEGSGFGIQGDDRMPIEKGSAIFVPKSAWHGVENPDSELLLLWVVAPPELEAFFREVGSAPGAPPKDFTSAQLNDIAQKHRGSLQVARSSPAQIACPSHMPSARPQRNQLCP